MQIHGVAHIHGPQSVTAPHNTPATQPSQSTGSSATVDQLDISPEADLVSRMAEVPDIRADRVADIRAAIQSGVYETDDKLNVTVERMLDEFA